MYSNDRETCPNDTPSLTIGRRNDATTLRQKYERYIGLARQEEAVGNFVEAESHYQQAEHYLHMRDISVVACRKPVVRRR
jgi:hypothetical protein